MDWTGIVGHILLYLLGLVGGGIGIAVTRFLEQKTQGVKNDTIRGLLAMVDQAAGDAVNATYQTAVNDLKAANADGKLTAEEAKAAFTHSVHAAWAAIVADAKKDLASLFGGTGGALQKVGAAVESKVAVAKVSGVATPTAKVAAGTPEQKAKAAAAARVQLGLSVQ